MLSHKKVVERFLERRPGRGARMSTDGWTLRDYGWYDLAWWVIDEGEKDTIIVESKPYPSKTSREHHLLMVGTFLEAGWVPVRPLEPPTHKPTWVLWGEAKSPPTASHPYAQPFYQVSEERIRDKGGEVVVRRKRNLCSLPLSHAEVLLPGGYVYRYDREDWDRIPAEELVRRARISEGSRRTIRSIRDMSDRAWTLLKQAEKFLKYSMPRLILNPSPMEGVGPPLIHLDIEGEWVRLIARLTVHGARVRLSFRTPIEGEVQKALQAHRAIIRNKVQEDTASNSSHRRLAYELTKAAVSSVNVEVEAIDDVPIELPAHGLKEARLMLQKVEEAWGRLCTKEPTATLMVEWKLAAFGKEESQ